MSSRSRPGWPRRSRRRTPGAATAPTNASTAPIRKFTSPTIPSADTPVASSACSRSTRRNRARPRSRASSARTVSPRNSSASPAVPHARNPMRPTRAVSASSTTAGVRVCGGTARARARSLRAAGGRPSRSSSTFRRAASSATANANVTSAVSHAVTPRVSKERRRKEIARIWSATGVTGGHAGRQRPMPRQDQADDRARRGSRPGLVVRRPRHPHCNAQATRSRHAPPTLCRGAVFARDLPTVRGATLNLIIPAHNRRLCAAADARRLNPHSDTRLGPSRQSARDVAPLCLAASRRWNVGGDRDDVIPLDARWASPSQGWARPARSPPRTTMCSGRRRG